MYIKKPAAAPAAAAAAAAALARQYAGRQYKPWIEQKVRSSARRYHSPGGSATLPVFSTQCTLASLRVDNETILSRDT